MSEDSSTLDVVVITPDALFRGKVPNQAPGGGPPARFLDILRNPQRVSRGAIGAKPGLTLTEAVRKSRSGGEELSFEQPVVLRPGAIVAAYDRGSSKPTPRTEYEQRVRERARARIFMDGHLGLECTLAGGMRSIDAVRGETFVACTEVELIVGAHQRLPFLAINSNRIESFSVLEEIAEG